MCSRARANALRCMCMIVYPANAIWSATAEGLAKRFVSLPTAYPLARICQRDTTPEQEGVNTALVGPCSSYLALHVFHAAVLA